MVNKAAGSVWKEIDAKVWRRREISRRCRRIPQIIRAFCAYLRNQREILSIVLSLILTIVFFIAKFKDIQYKLKFWKSGHCPCADAEALATEACYRKL